MRAQISENKFLYKTRRLYGEYKMYLRHKDLGKVLSSAREMVDNVLMPGQFLKIGMDCVGDVRSYWLFVPDFVGEIVDNKMIGDVNKKGKIKVAVG